MVLRLPGETGDVLAGQESNKVGHGGGGGGGGGGERVDESAGASLEEAAVSHRAEWAGPNCKGIMEGELRALIPGLRNVAWKNRC